LNLIGNRIRVAGSNIETWKPGCTAQRLSGSRRVTEWVPGSARNFVWTKDLSDSFFEGRVVWKN